MVITLQVSKTLQAKIRKGCPWVFSYQLQNPGVTGSPGDLGVIYDSSKKFLAIGFYDPFSDLRLRILQTGAPVEIGEDFFRRRLAEAVKLRQSLELHGTTGYRVLHGENDGFPGLVLDRYEDTLVLKLYTISWAPYLECLLGLIQEVLPVHRCVLRLSRNARKPVETHTRLRDGQALLGALPDSPVRFRENGLRFEADVLHGQKTGFFLDQRENRQRVRTLSRDRSVLNVFSYTGGFSVYALAGRCRSVLEIDSNPHALKASLKNIRLNFQDRIPGSSDWRQLHGDAFRLLDKLGGVGETFDMVLLDPPAFAGKKKQKARAVDAYRRLAAAGAGLVRPEGVLFAASCSVHVSPDDFFHAVLSGIHSAGKTGREFLRTGHSVDHPVSFQEGGYLKAIYLRIF
ncbi:MAG: class I SAM-dependent rRNA methyltransferase [Nitrospinaceae bacterium]